MSKVKAKDTKPELLIRRFLFANGYRYRLHLSDLPGKPDIVLKKYKTVVFVNGCFWHGHKNCKRSKLPETRRDWWENKINRNIINDQKSYLKLIQNGWRVIVVWECMLNPKMQGEILKKLSTEILKAKNSGVDLPIEYISHVELI